MINSELVGGSDNLSSLGIEELTAKWRRHRKDNPPDHLPKSALARLLEYYLQVERHGGLSKKAVAYLNAVERDLREGRRPETPYPVSQRLKPGSELVREHEGFHHRVMVMEEGFAWNGKAFKSLSAVAKAITGTNWNGNRFFGLNAKGNSAAEPPT
jgi:Protein of unknown function (DUF2924)